MKTFYGIIVIFGLLIGVCISTIGIHIKNNLEDKHSSFNANQIEKAPLGRGEHEYLYTHDPKSKSIPKGRLKQAKEYTKNRLKLKSAIPNIEWEERGPDNISGRTRAS